MIILDMEKSSQIRKKYIDAFVDTSSHYYVNQILKMELFSDGLCYIGYLWDCLKKAVVIPHSECEQFLNAKHNIFVMWDIHSAERIVVPNYWKYPKNQVLCINQWDQSIRRELPEDIYLFDESFSWSVVFTHETDANDDPFCLFLRKNNTHTRF